MFRSSFKNLTTFSYAVFHEMIHLLQKTWGWPDITWGYYIRRAEIKDETQNKIITVSARDYDNLEEFMAYAYQSWFCMHIVPHINYHLNQLPINFGQAVKSVTLAEFQAGIKKNQAFEMGRSVYRCKKYYSKLPEALKKLAFALIDPKVKEYLTANGIYEPQ